MKQILLAAAICLFGSAVFADEALAAWVEKTGGLESWKAQREYVIKMFQEHLFANLSPQEAIVFSQVQIVDDPSMDLGMIPKARKVAGSRKIVFSTAFFFELNAFATASMIESLFGKDGFSTQYARHCKAVIRAREAGNGSVSWTDPVTLAGLTKEEERQLFSREPQMTRWTIATTCAALIVAHEAAHHVLGDLEKKDRASKELLEAEKRADAWAVALLESAGLASYNAMHALDYFFGMQETLLKPSDQATHPPPEERILEVLKLTQGLIKGKPMPEPDREELLKRLEFEIKAAQHALEDRKRQKNAP